MSRLFIEDGMSQRSAFSERIEEVLFGGLTTEEREKVIAHYHAIDREFDEIRRQIQSARHVSSEKWRIPVF